MTKETREQWLEKATKLLDQKVFNEAGLQVPHDVKISCGWPVSGGASVKQATIGQCFARSASAAGVNEIFISPKLDDTSRVLDVLIHELIHAIDDCQNGHKAPFKRMALAVGLTGKMTATTASDELQERLNVLMSELGEYPHNALDYSKAKKQNTRMLKVHCTSCDFAFRANKSQIEKIDFTKGCLSHGCGGDLTIEIKD